jgi:hypothetical protein
MFQILSRKGTEMSRLSVRSLSLISGVVLAGCSSPYLYSAEIKNLRDGFTVLRTTMTDAQEGTTRDVRSFEAVALRRLIVTGRGSVALNEACAAALQTAIGSTTLQPQPELRCDLVVTSARQAPVTPAIYSGATSFKKAEEILSALEGYGNALVSITDAGDSKDLENAATSVCSSATTIAALAGGVLGAALGPACGLASLASITWLNNRRAEVLETAVQQVDASLMPRAQTYLAERLVQGAGQRLAARQRILENQLEVVNTSVGRDVVRREIEEQTAQNLFQNVATVQALLRTDPAEPAREMAEAHRALRLALGDSNRQSADVTRSVSEFLAAVVKLRDALKQAEA